MSQLAWDFDLTPQWFAKYEEIAAEAIMVQNGREVGSKAVLVKKRPSEIVIESESEAGELSRFVFRKVEPERKPEARK